MFSLLKIPFPGRASLPRTELPPHLLCLFFSLLYFFLPVFEDSDLLFCCLMSSASIQKLFCGVCSALKCFFEEFVREKVVFPSYSSAILGPPLKLSLSLPSHLFTDSQQQLLHCSLNRDSVAHTVLSKASCASLELLVISFHV